MSWHLTWTDKILQNGYDELEDLFYQSQENRARVLSSLHSRGLPVDVSFF